MRKIQVIDSCLQCQFSSVDREIDVSSECWHEKMSFRIIKDDLEIPEWCPLETHVQVPLV